MRTGLNQIPVARYKLSPNEEAQLLKKEREKKKKQRLIAVRLQAKEFSKKVLNDVRKEKQKQLQILAKEIENEWKEEKEEKLEKLEELYERNLKHVGGAHVAAVDQDMEGKQELRELVRQEDARIAQERGLKAVEKLLKDTKERYMEQTYHIRARQDVLDKEKARAAEVAAKPPVPADPIDQLQINKLKPIKFTDHDAFSQTHYHIPHEHGVVREDKENQESAHEVGKLEGERYDDLEAEKKRVEIERKEKARLRHKAALEKERLDLDYGNILHELSNLQTEDRIRRQKIVSDLPRIDQLQDDQRNMEKAFENMFIKNRACPPEIRDFMLDSQPVPPTPSDELSVSVMDEPEQTDHSEKESSQGDSTVRKLLDATKQPDGGLKTLLSRIKSQRDTWVKKTNVDGSPPRTLTQYSASETRSEGSSLETGEVDSKSTVSTKTQSEETSTQDEGTITSSGTITDTRTSASQESQTLLHPAEVGARIRHIPVVRDEVSQYLSMERQQQQQIALENQQIREEAQQRRTQLEKQKQELENKLRELEMKRRELQQDSSRSVPQQISSTTREPVTVHGLPQTLATQPSMPLSSSLYPGRQEPTIPVKTNTYGGLSSHPGTFSHTNQIPSAYQAAVPVAADSANQSQLSNSSAGISGYSYNIDKVREYQEKLLRRQGDQKEQMRLAREDLQKRVGEMLNKAKDDYYSVPLDSKSRLSNFPDVGPLPEVSPLGYFQDISPQYNTLEPSQYNKLEPSQYNTVAPSQYNTVAPSQYNTLGTQQYNRLEVQQGHVGDTLTVPQMQRLSLDSDKSTAGSSTGTPVEYRQSIPNFNTGLQTQPSLTSSSTSYGPPIPVIPTGNEAEQTVPRSVHTASMLGSLSARSDDPSISSYQSLGFVNGGQRMRAPQSDLMTGTQQPSGVIPLGISRQRPNEEPYSTSLNEPPLAMPSSYPIDSLFTSSSTYEDEFSASLSEKKKQLADIQRRKEEILERQKLQEEELQHLRERYEVDLMSNQQDSHSIGEINGFHSLEPDTSVSPPNDNEAINQQQSSHLPIQPVSGWTYESTHPLKPELSTIIEVDSPEKTQMTTTRLTGVSELSETTTTELSQGAIDDSSLGGFGELTSTTQSHGDAISMQKNAIFPYSANNSGFVALDSQLEDSSFQPLKSGIEITTSASQLQMDSSGSSADLSRPKLSRKWHDILAESSQSSAFSAQQKPTAEDIRGIPVGQSEPFLSGYSQFRQEVVGEEQSRLASTSNRSGPALASSQFMSLKEDPESTMISSIADDLPKDRDEYLELREGTPSPEDIVASTSAVTRVKVTRPLSSTPARAGQPTPVNIAQLRRPLLMEDTQNNMNSINFIAGNTPSTILGGKTPSTILGSSNQSTAALTTPSTGNATELTQYMIYSGGSTSSDGDSNRQGSMVPDLTQYPFSSSDEKTRLSASGGVVGGLPKKTLTYNDSDLQERTTQKMSGYLSDLSQYPDQSTASQLVIDNTGFPLGQPSRSQTESEQRGSQFTAEDPRSTVVRFAPGDPDVRFMSASSSEQGSQPYSFPAGGNLPYTIPYSLGMLTTPQTTTTQNPTSYSTVNLNPFSSSTTYQSTTTLSGSDSLFPLSQDSTLGSLTHPSRPDTIGANIDEMSSLSQFSAPIDDLSRRIEETMKKHEKLLEESRKMSEKHEQEKAKYSVDDLSLEPLEFKEQDSNNGITEEPDLTLVTVSGGDKLSVADLSSSLLSFEQHEKSQATLSDHNDKSLTIEKSPGGTLDSISTSDLRQRAPLEEGSSPFWLPLEPELTETTQRTSTLSPELTTTPVPTTNTTDHDTLSSSSTPTPVAVGIGSEFDSYTPGNVPSFWERDEGAAVSFRPLPEDETTSQGTSQDSRSQTHFISIPVGRVEEDSGNDSVQGLTLQEVFARKKAGFIEKSKKRKETTPVTATASTKSKQASQPPGSTSHMSKTMSNWKKSRSISKPSGIPQASPSMTTKTSADRKKAEEEMKQRTSRLYNQLEDVKEKKLEENRKQKYADNREKAKEYNRKLQESRLKKKAGIKKS